MLVPLLLICLQTFDPYSGAGRAHLPVDTIRPPRRAHHSMVYDEAGHRVLLTGGSTPLDGGSRFEMFNDLWAFDGVRWTALAPSGGKWSGSSLAYDTHKQRILAYGGYDGASLRALRVLEGDIWRTLPPHPELAAAEPGFVYDGRRGRFVAFGGSSGPGQPNGATWQFDGSNWSRVTTTSPPARQAHAMVYDEARGRTLMFGGMGQGPQGTQPPALGDTWEFDGQSWTQHNVVGPSPRFSPGAAYDSKRRRVILFGGLDASGFKGDTWAWDGNAWQKLADTGPEPRAMGYLAYDKQRDRIVLFGGRNGWPNGDLNDTWEWDGTSWRQVGG